MSICTEAVIVLFFSGLTYHWLLENVPGFCGWQVYAWKEEGISLNDANFLYKMSFMKYMDMFPEGREIIENKRAQRALGCSPEEKVKGQGEAIYRGPLMLSTKYW